VRLPTTYACYGPPPPLPPSLPANFFHPNVFPNGKICLSLINGARRTQTVACAGCWAARGDSRLRTSICCAAPVALPLEPPLPYGR